MKKLIILVFIFGLSPGIIFSQEYQLVWADEFDSTELDLSKWEQMIGDGSNYGIPGWGNNELEYYRPENTKVENGFLTITAKNENYGGRSYTSSRIRTLNKGDWKYGKFEFRAVMPIGQGIWPAIWMMPTNNVYGGWAASGEIDIMEYLGHEPDKVHGTLHYGGSWPNNTSAGQSYTLAEGTFHDDFHLFTLEWEEGIMKWYVDGELVQTRSSWWSSGGEFPAPFDQEFHIILNLAVGGNWPGSPDENTVFPQEFIIDYVRVYQKKTAVNINSPASPKKFMLRQNYPNPFNGETKISFEIGDYNHVKLILTDLQGDVVSTLIDNYRGSGLYTISLDMTGFSSGIYFYRLLAGNRTQSRKLIFLK